MREYWRQQPELKKLDVEEMHGPARFVVPRPTKSGSQREALKVEMTEHHSRWRILDVLQGSPLALDISVGTNDLAPSQRDLDNLARDVVVPFEEVFCANERGTVATYRVYTTELGPPGVRAHVYGDGRLHEFEQAIATTRRWLLARGPRFRDHDW